MSVTLTDVRRPILRWYGGKWSLAPWIISHMPAHSSYIEPFCGAASVLMRKQPVSIEVINDLDSRLITLFRVMREQPDELIRQLEWTPWSREEYQRALTLLNDNVELDDMELARVFFVSCWMSMQGGSNNTSSLKTTWRVRKNPSTTHGSAAYDLFDLSWLEQVRDRLKRVQVEHEDGFDVIERYDFEGALMYLDPPYLSETRSEDDMYEHEWLEDLHVRLAEHLRGRPSYFILSGYPSPLYAELFEAEGWGRRDTAQVQNSGSKRTESIWLSPNVVGALGDPASMQGSLFEWAMEMEP